MLTKHGEQPDVSPCTCNSIFYLYITNQNIHFVDFASPLQPQMAAKHGYQVETHQVVTDDGYVLNMHRIPRGRHSNSSDAENRPVAYIQHGLTSSSADWMVSGPDKALGIVQTINAFAGPKITSN